MFLKNRELIGTAVKQLFFDGDDFAKSNRTHQMGILHCIRCPGWEPLDFGVDTIFGLRVMASMVSSRRSARR